MGALGGLGQPRCRAELVLRVQYAWAPGGSRCVGSCSRAAIQGEAKVAVTRILISRMLTYAGTRKRRPPQSTVTTWRGRPSSPLWIASLTRSPHAAEVFAPLLHASPLCLHAHSARRSPRRVFRATYVVFECQVQCPLLTRTLAQARAGEWRRRHSTQVWRGPLRVLFKCPCMGGDIRLCCCLLLTATQLQASPCHLR